MLYKYNTCLVPKCVHSVSLTTKMVGKNGLICKPYVCLYRSYTRLYSEAILYPILAEVIAIKAAQTAAFTFPTLTIRTRFSATPRAVLTDPTPTWTRTPAERARTTRTAPLKT